MTDGQSREGLPRGLDKDSVGQAQSCQCVGSVEVEGAGSELERSDSGGPWMASQGGGTCSF